MGKHIDDYKQMHEAQRYGISSEGYAKIIAENKPTPCNSVLDYSCGQSKLLEIINAPNPYWYDPAVKGRDVKPPYQEFDWIINTDVLEHIPEDELDQYIEDILQYGDRVFFVIATALDGFKLPDGSPAHCTVHPKEWWLEYLGKYFPVLNLVPKLDNHFRFAVKTY